MFVYNISLLGGGGSYTKRAGRGLDKSAGFSEINTDSWWPGENVGI